MKDCDIVKDLLPLVAEDMASESTKEYVNTHLETCEDCKKAYEALKTPVQTDAAAPLKTVRKSVKKRGWLIAGLIACLVAALFAIAAARLLKPIPIRSAEEVFDTMTVSVLERGTEMVQGQDIVLPWSAEEMGLFASDKHADSYFSVKTESQLVAVDADGMIRKAEEDNGELFMTLEILLPDFSDTDSISADRLREIANEQRWMIWDAGGQTKDGTAYLELIFPDRVTVTMRSHGVVSLKGEWQGAVFGNTGSVASESIHIAQKNRTSDEPTAESSIMIYAYTTRLQQLMALLGLEGDVSKTLSFMMYRDDLDAVYFEPFNNTEHETLYLRKGYEPEAGYALPRLVMNYYFLIALVGTILLAAVWFILRFLKKQKASRVFGVLLLIAASGVLAFLFAGFPATTIAPARELAFVCVIAALLIGAGLCGRKLLRKE